MILNLRGGNGSGKTTIHHWLIDNHDAEPMFDPNFFTEAEKKANAWKLPGGLYIIGKYTGGGDSVLFESLKSMVRGFSQEGHVFFENVLVSGSKHSWLNIRKEMSDQDWVWATLDTSPEICLERIYSRNGGKPIKEDIIIGFNKRVRSLQEWLASEGEKSYLLDHTQSIKLVHDLLTEGGWNCGTSHQW